MRWNVKILDWAVTLALSAACCLIVRLLKYSCAIRCQAAAGLFCLLSLSTVLAKAQGLPAPVLIGPGTTNEPGPELEAQTFHLSWEPVTSATGYRVFVRDLTTDELRSSSLVPDATNLSLTLITGHSYRWNMVALADTNLSEHSQTFYFQIKQAASNPRITEVSPFPVPAIDFPQVITVYGYDILRGCQIILRHRDSGETFRNLKQVHRHYRFVSITANFTSVPAQWSVEVINPGGYSSGEFAFPVVTPERIPAWRWWRSGWPWACGGFLFFFVTGTCLWWTVRRRLPRKIAQMRHQTQREERDRLVRDLHDRASADLARLANLADLTLLEPTSLPMEAQTRIRELLDVAHDAVTAFGDLLWAAHPQSEDLQQLAAQIRSRIIERLRPHAIEPDFSQWPVPVPSVVINAAVSSQVLYITHEILNNALKHSRATKLENKLKVEDGWLVLGFRDNGQGLQPHSKPGSGRGLTNMRNRVQRLGGKFEIKSAPGEGTEVTVRLPLDQVARATA